MKKWLTLCLSAVMACPALDLDSLYAADSGSVLAQMTLKRMEMKKALRAGDVQSYERILNQTTEQYSFIAVLDDREQMLSALVLGKYDWLRDSLGMEYLARGYYRRAYAAFCPNLLPNYREQKFAKEDAELLTDLVVYWNKLGGVTQLKKSAPDLALWAQLSTCKSEAKYLNYEEDRSQPDIAKQIALLPEGSFKNRLKAEWSKEYRPSGAGFVIGGGPSYAVMDGALSDLANDGTQGGFDIGIWTVPLTVSLNVNFRSFRSKAPLKLEDTLFAAGRKMSMPQVGVHLGHNFVLGSHWIARPFVGVEYMSVDKSVDSTYNNDKEVSTWGASYPLGLELDFSPFQGNSELIGLAGLRLFSQYAWNDLDLQPSGRGTGYWRTGLYFTLGLLGSQKVDSKR